MGMDRDDQKMVVSGYVRGAPPAYHDFLTGAALMMVMTIGSTPPPSRIPGFPPGILPFLVSGIPTAEPSFVTGLLGGGVDLMYAN